MVRKTRVILPGGIQGLVHDLQNGKGAQTVQSAKEDKEIYGSDNDAPKSTQYGLSGNGSTAIGATAIGAAANGATAIGAAANGATANGATANGASSSTPSNTGRQTAESAAAEKQAPESAIDKQTTGGVAAGKQATEGVAADKQATGGVDGKAEQNKPIGDLPGRSYSPGRPPKQNTMKEYHIVKDDSQDSWQLFLDMAKQYKDGGGKLATIYIDSTLKTVLDRMKYAGPEKLPTSAILSSIVARFIYDHEDDIRKALFSGNII